MTVRSACASKPGHLRAGTGGSSSCCSCEARPSPSGSRPLAAAARSRGAERMRRIQTPGGPEVITVAILAQGTHWAVALAQAFWPGFDPRPARVPSPERSEREEEKTCIARSSTVAREDISTGICSCTRCSAGFGFRRQSVRGGRTPQLLGLVEPTTASRITARCTVAWCCIARARAGSSCCPGKGCVTRTTASTVARADA